ncbi:MAG: SUMF1/EgtB/PvdO family nonheme iron enzyme [Verrucomicrobiota bacterium]
MKTSKYSYLGLSLALMLATMPAWGVDGSLPTAAESRSRAGNVQGSLIEGRVVTTFDGTKQEQDWYALTLAKLSPVGWVVFTHGSIFHDGGWFDTSKGKPQVQVQAVKDGPWKMVGELTDYPATTATDSKSIQNDSRFACTLASPVTALAVRVIGRPACGDNPEQSFSSSAGLTVYRSPVAGGVKALTSSPNPAESPLSPLESKLKMAAQTIPGPNQDNASITSWLADMKKWRELKLVDIQYYGTEYDRPELQWCHSAFVQPQMMVEDRYFYDPVAGKYTVDRYLDDLEKRYGGIDAVLIWHVYPNIGIDNQNPFDQLRSLPGGLPALKQMVADFHRRGVHVLFPTMPWWTTGVRDEGVTIPTAIARDMKTIGADGVNGDTMQSMGKDYTFRTESDKSGNILAFEPEGAVAAGEKELPWINMGWGYWGTPAKNTFAMDYYIPPVSKYKWLEPRHMVNICDRWARDRNQDLQSAFFKGTGYESWESVWCIWNGFTPRDGEALRRTATIERAYPDLLISRDWEPHTPTLQKGVFASRFPGAHATLWTLINRFPYQIEGPQLRVPASPGVRYFDLWHGVELKPAQEGQELIVSFEMEGYGFGSVLAVSGAADPKLTALLDKMRTYSAKHLADFSGEWKFLPQEQVAIAATAPAKSAPAGMTRIPGGSFNFKVEGIEIEGFNSIGTDVQYPWEDSPRRYHSHPVTLKPYFIDTYPVTNEEFKKFVDAANFHPRDDGNFLKDWKNGTYPEGWGKKPVTWVSLEDARAYAAWAGKRLPHETEWQYAAQGGDGRLYPWGSTPNAEAIPPECKDKNVLRPPTDVDAFPKGASPFGVMDMVGNVWQWTDEYLDEHSRGGILRGGSYFHPQGSIWFFPNKIELNTHGKLLLMAPSRDRAATLGFRCVVDGAE